MDDRYDIYPFLHGGKIYNLITAIDLTFAEVRLLIDHLEKLQAFSISEEDEFMGPGKLFSIELNDIVYEVDVLGYEIAIYSREDLSDELTE
jgi:hypothetical protein